MENEKRRMWSITQKQYFIDALKAQNKHFYIYDPNKAWDVEMTEKQYKHLLYLLYNKKYFQIKKIMDAIGFVQIPKCNHDYDKDIGCLKCFPPEIYLKR